MSDQRINHDPPMANLLCVGHGGVCGPWEVLWHSLRSTREAACGSRVDRTSRHSDAVHHTRPVVRAQGICNYWANLMKYETAIWTIFSLTHNVIPPVLVDRIRREQ
jgi:hypothetical protein